MHLEDAQEGEAAVATAHKVLLVTSPDSVLVKITNYVKGENQTFRQRL
jgi:hypothetical protein